MFSSTHANPVVQTEESLPFLVEIASPEQLQEVADLRAETYGKHLPALGATLSRPEAADTTLGCEVFVARSKLDGSLLGTLRTHSNAFVALPLQASLDLPERFNGTRMVETTRLCVKSNLGASTVRTALFKALHQYCLNQNVQWMLAAARRSVDRIHDGLLFKDVRDERVYYPMAHAGGVPHRVLFFSPSSAEQLWRNHRHPLHHFVFETHHPDIDVSEAHDLNFEWQCPRNDAKVTYLPERLSAAQQSEHFESSAPMALLA